MQIIAVCSSKGGTGKTSTAAALAQAAAYRGRRVLAIDLDPQANLSFTLGADTTAAGSDLLLSGTDPGELIQRNASGIDIIPASPALAVEKSSTGSARRMQTALEPIKNSYDLIIIDTPTTPGNELQFNALQACSGLLIPLQADAYCVQSLYQITRTARQIQAASNPKLQILGFILTQHTGRAQSPDERLFQ